MGMQHKSAQNANKVSQQLIVLGKSTNIPCGIQNHTSAVSVHNFCGLLSSKVSGDEQEKCRL